MMKTYPDTRNAVKLVQEATGWNDTQVSALIARGLTGEIPMHDVEILCQIAGMPRSFAHVLADDPDKKPVGTLQKIILDRLGKEW